ncbi:hypothetical protein EDD21DRAFT_386599 [Dissophora ornata]|nr:hypothetical protein EDD21DRAFT_386599 [Dissophora ornata]
MHVNRSPVLAKDPAFVSGRFRHEPVLIRGFNRDSYLSLNDRSRDRDYFHALLARRYTNSNSRTVEQQKTPPSLSSQRRLSQQAPTSRQQWYGMTAKSILARILVRPSLARLESQTLEAAAAAATTTCSRSSEEAATAKNVDRPRRPSTPHSSSSLSDPSVSFHGSSYSYFPIHEPGFAFGQVTVAKQTSSLPEPIHPQMPESKDLSATVQATEGVVTTTTVTATPTRRSPPAPPVRPPRRRPVTVQKNDASPSLSLSSLSLSNSVSATNLSRSSSPLLQLMPVSRPREQQQQSNATFKPQTPASTSTRPSPKVLDQLFGVVTVGQ